MKMRYFAGPWPSDIVPYEWTKREIFKKDAEIEAKKLRKKGFQVRIISKHSARYKDNTNALYDIYKRKPWQTYFKGMRKK